MKIWQPNPLEIQKTNIFQSMKQLGFHDYNDFWKWSVTEREKFWEFVINRLEIPFIQKPTQILDVTKGVTKPQWLVGAKLNIADVCFKAEKDSLAIIYKSENSDIQELTYFQLEQLVNRIANSFSAFYLKKGDVIAMDMSMNVEAVAIYLAAIKAGLSVATIADSFTAQEIEIRLKITQPKIVFTQDYIERNHKKLPLYTKVCEANPEKIVVITSEKSDIKIRKEDMKWNEFLSPNTNFTSVACDPSDITTILFSSGTTATPKAIPWTHTTPVKCASDGFFHHDIHAKEVVAWPTNMGWMMGPWLVFATLINRGTIAIYGGTPQGRDFGEFIIEAGVNILGLVPSIVKQWKSSQCMEGLNFTSIKCLSSTGEASNYEEYTYLMELMGNKPVIEYCGGTEIGEGYVSGTLIQNNIPSAFSTKALGSDFILLDDNHKPNHVGEVFLIPPTMGLSDTLLNKNHDEVYYDGVEPFEGIILRRHGDQMEQLENGYFKALGRMDDSMNLGGIKVSSIQIEEVINKLDFVIESAAISIPPKGGGPENLIIYYVSSSDILPALAHREISDTVKAKINPLFKVFESIAVAVLPRTASGKIMRRNLRNQKLSEY